jgi:hypothetical protein
LLRGEKKLIEEEQGRWLKKEKLKSGTTEGGSGVMEMVKWGLRDERLVLRKRGIGRVRKNG